MYATLSSVMTSILNTVNIVNIVNIKNTIGDIKIIIYSFANNTIANHIDFNGSLYIYIFIYLSEAKN